MELHYATVDVAPHAPLKIDTQVGEFVGLRRRRGRRGGRRAGRLRPGRQRHSRRLSKPGARQPSWACARHIPRGAVNDEIPHEELLHRLAAILRGRLALDPHAAAARDS